MDIVNRQRGTLIGLAVGDALGAAVEFRRPGTFAEVTDYRGGGPHGLGPGEWTDDTSLALALADSIAEAGWDLNDQARRYVAWWRTGRYSVNDRCFDIGTTTRMALARFERTGDARTSADRTERASGNGSIMRLAPVPIRYAGLFPDRLEELVDYLAESSLPTHGSPQCLSACAYLGLVLCGLIHGIDREEVLAPDWEPLVRLRAIQPLHPEVDEVAAGSFRQRRPPEIVGSGYVVKCLEAALWAIRRRRGLPPGGPPRGEPRRRRRHDRRRLRPVGRRLLGRNGDSATMAREAGPTGHDRTCTQGYLVGQWVARPEGEGRVESRGVCHALRLAQGRATLPVP